MAIPIWGVKHKHKQRSYWTEIAREGANNNRILLTKEWLHEYLELWIIAHTRIDGVYNPGRKLIDKHWGASRAHFYLDALMNKPTCDKKLNTSSASEFLISFHQCCQIVKLHSWLPLPYRNNLYCSSAFIDTAYFILEAHFEFTWQENSGDFLFHNEEIVGSKSPWI